MDDDEEAVSNLNKLWNDILLSLSSKADSSSSDAAVHVFSTKFLYNLSRGRLPDLDSWSKCVSILSHVLVDRLKTTQDPFTDPVCWKLLCMVKLIGVTHLAFKSELLKSIDDVWSKFVEPANFDGDDAIQFPSLIDATVSPLSCMVDPVLPCRSRSLPRPIDTTKVRRKSLQTKPLKKEPKRDPNQDDKGNNGTSSSAEDLPTVCPSVKSPIVFEDRSLSEGPPGDESVESKKLCMNEEELQLFDTCLSKVEFANILLDVLRCFYKTELHFGRIVFYNSSNPQHLLFSLRLLLQQILKEKSDSVNIEWLADLLTCFKVHKDQQFREECITVLLTISYHLVNNSSPKFKTNLLTILVRINELGDEAISTEKHCTILCDVAISLKHLRMKSTKHCDVFHHSDRYGVPYGTASGQHMCVVAKICERLIRLISKFHMGALLELRRVAFCCCFSPLASLLSLFEKSEKDAERACILEALESFHKKPGSCRVCVGKNRIALPVYAETLFSTRSKALASHLSVICSLKNNDTRMELYTKIVVPAFTYLGLEDLPLVFPLLASLFDTLPNLCKKFFDEREYVELLGSFIYVSEPSSQVVSMRLYETIIGSSMAALESFINIVEDEMLNYLQGNSESVLALISKVLETLHKARVVVSEEEYIRSRFSFLDTSYRLLINLVSDLTTNVSFQICDNVFSMLLKLCPLQLWSFDEKLLLREELCRAVYKAIPKDKENYSKVSLLLTGNIHNKCSGYIITDCRFSEEPPESVPKTPEHTGSLELLTLDEPEGYEADSESCSVDAASKVDGNTSLVSVYPEVAGLCLDVVCYVMKANRSAADSLTGALRQLSIMCLQNKKLLGVLLELGTISKLCRSYLSGYRKFKQSPELTEAMLYVVQLISKQSIQSDEVFDLLQLFKVEQPPYDLLLDLLGQLLSLNPGPCRILSISPFLPQDLDSTNQTWLSKMKTQFYSLNGPWSSEGASVALPLSTVIELDHIALSIWYKLEQGTVEKKPEAGDSTSIATHIVSVGNRQSLMEVWHRPSEGHLIINVSQCRPHYEVVWSHKVLVPQIEPRHGASWVSSWNHVFLEVAGHNKVSVCMNGQRLHNDSFPSKCLTNVEVTLLASELHPIKVASLIVFRGLERGEHASTLYHLGPSFHNLVECPITAETWYCKELQEFLKPLQKHITFAYLPTTAAKFVTYPKQSKFNSFFTTVRQSQLTPIEQDVFYFSENPCASVITPHYLQNSIVSLGGYQVFLFLFAWVIERTDNPDYHADALDIVLKGVSGDRATMTDFLREGMGLTLIVLQNDKCKLTVKLLKVCLAHCCDLSEGKLVRPEILARLVLMVWLRWDSESIECLANFLTMLIRERNRHAAMNVQHLVKLNAIDKLLTILKENLNDPRITPSVGSNLLQFVDCVVNISGYPHSLLSSLVDFLVLYHNATLTYVVHTRTNKVQWAACNGTAVNDAEASESSPEDGAFSTPETDSSFSDNNGNLREKSDQDPPSVSPMSPVTPLTFPVTPESGVEGVQMFVCGLYNIFCNVLTIQGSTVSTLKPELLLVLANEPSATVRVAVITCLAKYLEVDSDAQESFLRLNGYHLLANQLSQFPSDERLLVALLQLCSGVKLLNLDQEIRSGVTGNGWPDGAMPLMACLSKCPSSKVCARYIIAMAQVVSVSTRLGQGMIDNNIIEVVCELLPFVNSSLSKALYSLIYVLVLFCEKSRAQFVIQFYLRLYTTFINNDPGCRTVKYIPRFYSALLQGFCDSLEYNIGVHVGVPEENRNEYTSFYSESLSSGASTGSTTDVSKKSIPLIGRVLRLDYPTESPRRKVGQAELDRHLLLSVELFQYSRPSVLLCREGFSCLERIIGILSGCAFHKDVPTLTRSANYQMSNLILALLRPTVDIEQRLECASILNRTPRLEELLKNIAANKLQVLCGFVNELYEGSKYDLRAKLMLETIKTSLHIETGFYCEMKRQKWLSQFESDRKSFLELQSNSALNSNQFVASKINLDNQNVTDSAMKVTRTVVDFQNSVRKQYFGAYKNYKCAEYNLKLKWKAIAQRLTHERAVWHMPQFVPSFWELDPTEGPWRIRKRLRRAHLNLEGRFWIDDMAGIPEYTPPLSFLYWNNVKSDKRLHTLEQIRSVYPCSMITASVETKGEVLIGLESVRFVPEDEHLGALSWHFNTITEIMLRRYEHADVAVEMFLNSGLTCLLIFEITAHKRDFYEKLVPNCSKLQKAESLALVTARWQKRQMTNFEYLTVLNKMAGRSFNNLMQYPVFPFVLSQYEGDDLDLTDPRSFRILDRPIAVQDKAREIHYIENYKQTQENQSLSVVSGPFHYGSHYSNSGIVLHFLVRVPPFTQAFLSYQDDNFDIPDRTFHSLETTWRLASRDSPTDVKELIPEFFYFPEFLRNIFKFDFGIRQTGDRVNDVKLPKWCENDARLFNLINLAALECDYVSERLNNWIDLVFGYKQQGRYAVDSINVFHPSTYAQNIATDSMDSIAVKAYKTMIKTYGQMPIQLFQQSHPVVNLNATSALQQHTKTNERVLNNVLGIRWGSYVGSMDDIEQPECIWSKCFSTNSFGAMVVMEGSKIVGVPPLTDLYNDEHTTALISWNHADRVVRIKTRKDNPFQPLIDSARDPVSFIRCVANRNEIFVGHVSGLIWVHKMSVLPSICALHSDTLIGHKSSILHIDVCTQYFIVASTSSDGSAILWDLNSLKYVRTILQVSESLTLVKVSPTMGDTAIVQDVADEGSKLHLYTINGVFIAQLESSVKITSLDYSSAPEGASVNVILTGHQDGSLRLYSSWNLVLLRKIATRMRNPVVHAVFSSCNQFMFVCDISGQVCAWGRPSKTNNAATPPKFLQEKI